MAESGVWTLKWTETCLLPKDLFRITQYLKGLLGIWKKLRKKTTALRTTMDSGAMRRGGQPRSSIPAKRSAADAQEDAWVADEDRFVLKQAKKKAIIRARAGRADPIDLLAVTLRALDATKNGYDSDDDDQELPTVDPEAVFEGLDDIQLEELDKGIDTYLALEQSRSNRDFWNVRSLIHSIALTLD